MRPAFGVGRFQPGNLARHRDWLRCAFLAWSFRRSLAALREMSPRDESQSVGDGDGPDFDLLYRRHAPSLRRRLRARVRSADEANDLVQDAFARLLGARSVARVRDPAAFLNRLDARRRL